MIKEFYTAAQKLQVINKVKDSKFYGSIARVDTETEARDFIETLKKHFHDATHNVSAFKIGIGDQAQKYANDDGEPAGSSGPPVLQAIEGEGLTNTVIVVTRYFGGTKLGIGGLIRAYGDTARLAIQEAGKKKLSLHYRILIKTNYQSLGKALGQIEAYHGNILAIDYDNEGVEILSVIKPEVLTPLKQALIEVSGNKVLVTKQADLFF